MISLRDIRKNWPSQVIEDLAWFGEVFTAK